MLLDLTMPLMGGGEVFREMRRLRPDLRIVVMSGHDEHAATELVERTRSRFLAKPFTLEELRERLV